MLCSVVACVSVDIEPVPPSSVSDEQVPEPAYEPVVEPEAEAEIDEEPAGIDCSICDPGSMPFGAGAGTADDPALLCSAEHLDGLRVAVDARARVCADIHLGGFEPIPLFRGVLDGGEHTLYGWTVDRPDATDVAFIVALDGGVLRSLRFAEVSLNTYASTAVAVHHTVEHSRARIQDVRVEGQITTASGHVAGVVGTVARGTEVVSASFSGSIDNADFGFVAGVVDRCAGSCRKLVAEGELTTDAWKAGCVVQTVEGDVEGAICRMDMSARNRAGGIAGELLGGTIRGSYFEGSLQGDYWLGGLIGEVWDHDGLIEQSYAAGTVTSAREHSGVGAAGVVAWAGGELELVDVLWDHDRGPAVDSIGGHSLTTEEMHDPDHHAFEGWTGWQHVPGDYPRLPWE